MKKLKNLRLGKAFEIENDFTNYWVRGEGGGGRITCKCYTKENNARNSWMDRNFPREREVGKYEIKTTK